MAKESWDVIYQHMLESEGGLANRSLRDDPGGLTMRGITHDTYDRWRDSQHLPRRPVTQITDDEHYKITKDLYWDKVRGDDLPVGLDYALFDFGFMSRDGPGIAIRKALGLPEKYVTGQPWITDDILKKIKEESEQGKGPKDLLDDFMDQRTSYLHNLSNYSANPGWDVRDEKIKQLATDAIKHGGFNEAQDYKLPGFQWDPDQYLLDRPDVAAAGVDPAYHYWQSGKGEGLGAAYDSSTVPRFTPGWGGAQPAGYQAWLNKYQTPYDESKLGRPKDVKWDDPLVTYNDSRLGKGVNFGPSPEAPSWFDKDTYLHQNTDVANSGWDAFQHYMKFGEAEGRAAPVVSEDGTPAWFDKNTYLHNNTDVANSGWDAFQHYLKFGRDEGRALPSAADPLGGSVQGEAGGWMSPPPRSLSDDPGGTIKWNPDGTRDAARIARERSGPDQTIDKAVGPIGLPEDVDWARYARENPDVAASPEWGTRLPEHLTENGAREGRKIYDSQGRELPLIEAPAYGAGGATPIYGPPLVTPTQGPGETPTYGAPGQTPSSGAPADTTTYGAPGLTLPQGPGLVPTQGPGGLTPLLDPALTRTDGAPGLTPTLGPDGTPTYGAPGLTLMQGPEGTRTETPGLLAPTLGPNGTPTLGPDGTPTLGPDGTQQARMPWDAEAYLTARPDVRISGMDPAYHYQKWGRNEPVGGLFEDASVPRFTPYWGGTQDAGYQPWIGGSARDPFGGGFGGGFGAGGDGSYLPGGSSANDPFGPPTRSFQHDPNFDAQRYYEMYPDVKAAGVDAEQHFQHSSGDRRAFSRDGTEIPPPVDAAIQRMVGDPGQAQPNFSGMAPSQEAPAWFDKNTYLHNNQDVANSGWDAFRHYVEHGEAEGRAAPIVTDTGTPAWFDKETYLHQNQDVANSGWDAFQHYIKFGRNEGRALPTTSAETQGAPGLTPLLQPDTGALAGAPGLTPLLQPGFVPSEGPPDLTPTYGAPAQTPGYGVPADTPPYAPPPLTPNEAPPAETPPYAPPGLTPTYGAPAGTPPYGAPPETPTYAPPPETPTYGAPADTPAYGAPGLTSLLQPEAAPPASAPGLTPLLPAVEAPTQGPGIVPTEPAPAQTPSAGAPPALKPWNPDEYFADNPDVARSGLDPLYHLMRYGLGEGRGGAYDTSVLPRFTPGWGGAQDAGYQSWIGGSAHDPLGGGGGFGAGGGNAYLPSGPSARDPFGTPASNFQHDPNFDAGRYYEMYPDVAAAGVDAEQHFQNSSGDRRAFNRDGTEIPPPSSYPGWGVSAQDPLGGGFGAGGGSGGWNYGGGNIGWNPFGGGGPGYGPGNPSDPHPLGSGISYNNGSVQYGGVDIGKSALFNPAGAEQSAIQAQVDLINQNAQQSQAWNQQNANIGGFYNPTYQVGIQGANVNDAGNISQLMKDQLAYTQGQGQAVQGLLGTMGQNAYGVTGAQPMVGGLTPFTGGIIPGQAGGSFF